MKPRYKLHLDGSLSVITPGGAQARLGRGLPPQRLAQLLMAALAVAGVLLFLNFFVPVSKSMVAAASVLMLLCQGVVFWHCLPPVTPASGAARTRAARGPARRRAPAPPTPPRPPGWHPMKETP
ncbi:hypothetical protein EBQ34_00520 [Vandammella animalimorsus]|uniref:Uncharacterized protein n=1 Tax=Vandammella animalimorsus TaxID=2029117 RepID=A0A3M6RU35_9BURK|nr:hypothetical protein [Vandammella animalimorsus]RMX18880.1 hypothetical protein EBQ34_00520 [Vandammella animalimorsus]